MTKRNAATKQKKRKKADCGTSAGYVQHFRNSERPCNQCLIGGDTYSEAEVHELFLDFQYWNRALHLWSTYGLSHERFNEIFEAQGSCCACCLTTVSGGASWYIDHDPCTNLIRGVLCHSCNAGVELLGDNLKGLQQAVAYLQAHEARKGHEGAKEPPKPYLRVRPSAVMERCFALFNQAVTRPQAVIIMRLTPATIDAIYTLWCRSGARIGHASRHIFQIPKDSPNSFKCSCGYTAEWASPDEMEAAIDQVNAHIQTAGEVEWKTLKAEENAYRLKEEQRNNEEQRRAAVEEMRRREEARHLTDAKEMRRPPRPIRRIQPKGTG